jgi:hypothetical protein
MRSQNLLLGLEEGAAFEEGAALVNECPNKLFFLF